MAAALWLTAAIVLMAGFDAFTFHAGAPVTTILGFLILVDGVRIASQSPHAAASWMLEVAPMKAKDALLGLRAAVFIAYFSMPFFVTTILRSEA